MTAPIYDTVAYLAADQFAVSNAAGDAFVSEFGPGLRLRADCGSDGVLLGTVTASSHDAGAGRTVVTAAMDGGAALTANLAGLLHGNDVPESLCAHAALHAPGGRDALPAASAGVSGLVSLATTAETRAGMLTTKAVTPAGLAASAKGLIATNTTIYVATTGDDASGLGTAAAPYASIGRALNSIARMQIADDAEVIIQVADGTYNITEALSIRHPDGDKIRILGNTSTETTAAISSIDTTAKTITVAGNYVSNADATKNIQAGDIVGLTGSSTSGLNGAYVVSGANYNGANTIITCSTETFASATVGGGSIVIQPCNKCVLISSAGTAVVLNKIRLFDGFKVVSSSLGNHSGIRTLGQASIGGHLILTGFYSAFDFNIGSTNIVYKNTIKSCHYGYVNDSNAYVYYGAVTITIDGCTVAFFARASAYVFLVYATVVGRNNSITYSPAVNAAGNGNAYIQTI